MKYKIKVVDVELSKPFERIQSLEGYDALKGIVRFHGRPLGYIQVPVIANYCTFENIKKQALEQFDFQIINQLLINGLLAEKDCGLKIQDLLSLPPVFYKGDLPGVTVVVCTRDRTEQIKPCLESLKVIEYPGLEILIIDNAPSDDGTKKLIQKKYPDFRYVCEPRPGLDWARNRAVLEATKEIIAYTDDDVVVDRFWVMALGKRFAEESDVMALTGLVVPYELETEAQLLFEKFGGFGRGFERKYFSIGISHKVPWYLLGTGQFGTGANMAFRRGIFEEIGHFDPALDVGTATNGGGDLEMFFRVLKAGYTLVYEPEAMIRHCHRREYNKLKAQIYNNGGFFAYLLSSAQFYPDQRWSFLRIGFSYVFKWWHIPRLIDSYIYPQQFPREMLWSDLKGVYSGLTSYPKAKKKVQEIINSFGPIPIRGKLSKRQHFTRTTGAIAVRKIELSQTMQSINGLEGYGRVRVFVTWMNKPLGCFDIANQGLNLSATGLSEAIVNHFGRELINPGNSIKSEIKYFQAITALVDHFKILGADPYPNQLPENITVSVVVATFDRPDDLRQCLASLFAQKVSRHVEIIIVDNHPESGLTANVMEDFKEAKFIKEYRQGLSYARNAGILASTGNIIVCTDDDVTMPGDWLEKLVVPFVRSDVMVVTGNVLPLRLETASQQAFETYGGLGRGYSPFEVDSDWFEHHKREAVPTWNLGATANAAFRSCIFANPEIGLMEETLGAGMPAGVAEDTYIFYKVLKVPHYRIIYQPDAYVWHKHRIDDDALKKQLYSYSKGHVAYHLLTWLKDGDWRGLRRILITLPKWHISRLIKYFRHPKRYPLSLIFLEISGNILGPWALWKSYQRVRREGRSGDQ